MVQLFDRIGKDTGPGKIVSELSGAGDLICTYVLYNFNVDGNVLKLEHKKFLDQHLIPLLRWNSFHARLTGTASKSGDREYNRQLSLGRLLRVKLYLRDKGGIPESKVPGSEIRAAGEDLSVSALQEDAIDRAVMIVVATGIKWKSDPRIVLPKGVTEKPIKPDTKENSKPNPDPNKTDKWEIQQLTGVNFSVGPSVGPIGIGTGTVQYHFLLRDQKKTKMAQCTFFGVGASGGGAIPKVPLTGSYTDGSGKWNEFTTSKPVAFDDFNGEAKWFEAAVGPLVSATSKLEFLDIHSKADVDTGVTIGLPAATVSPGSFYCRDPVPLDYWPNGR